MTMTQVKEYVSSRTPGELISTHQLARFGSRAAVDQALSRLVRTGALMRVARGVFSRPKVNPHVGAVPPTPAAVAEIVARETGSRIQIHGAEAARQMGFSTQVPAQPVFYTDGPSRRIRMGRLEVVLKHVSPRKLALAGRPAGVALTALWYLGKHHLTHASLEQVRQRLGEDEFGLLCSAAEAMPGWMRDQFLRYREARDGG